MQIGISSEQKRSPTVCSHRSSRRSASAPPQIRPTQSNNATSCSLLPPRSARSRPVLHAQPLQLFAMQIWTSAQSNSAHHPSRQSENAASAPRQSENAVTTKRIRATYGGDLDQSYHSKAEQQSRNQNLDPHQNSCAPPSSPHHCSQITAAREDCMFYSIAWQSHCSTRHDSLGEIAYISARHAKVQILATTHLSSRCA